MKNGPKHTFVLLGLIVISLLLIVFSFQSLQILGYAEYDFSVKDTTFIEDTFSCTDSNYGIFSTIPGTVRLNRWFGTFTFTNVCDPVIKRVTDFRCVEKSVVKTQLPCPICNGENTACKERVFEIPVDEDLPPEEFFGSGSGMFIPSPLTLEVALKKSEPGDKLSLRRSGDTLDFFLLQKSSCSLFLIDTPLEDFHQKPLFTDFDRYITQTDPKGNTYTSSAILHGRDPSLFWEFVDQSIAWLDSKYQKYSEIKTGNKKIKMSVCDLDSIEEGDLKKMFGRKEIYQKKDFSVGFKVTLFF
ncbi:MAG: hypothetical protein AABY00_02725 [Nanoarchaeota archaeon]